MHQLSASAEAQASVKYPVFSLFVLGAFYIMLVLDDALLASGAVNGATLQQSRRNDAAAGQPPPAASSTNHDTPSASRTLSCQFAYSLRAGRAKETVAALCVLLLLEGLHAGSLREHEQALGSLGVVLSRLVSPSLALGLQLMYEHHSFQHAVYAAIPVALCVPLGILLGLAYSKPNYWTLSVGNGASAGVLLHVAFAELIGPVFDVTGKGDADASADHSSKGKPEYDIEGDNHSLRAADDAALDTQKAQALSKQQENERYQQFLFLFLGVLPVFLLEIAASVARGRASE